VAEALPVATSDSSDVVATIARLHAALASGDSAGALAVLTTDALIVESGSVETRADYRAHHLPADIEFARAVPSTRTITRVTVQGDVAWVVSTSTSQGQVNGRAVNSTGAELTVLRRAAAGWQITAVHWSSRSRRAGS
jgi:ketosteroid isomerase-like protein